MKYIKFIAMFFFSIFLISFILPQNIVVLPHARAQSNDRSKIIDRFLIKFYNWSWNMKNFLGFDSIIKDILFNPMRTPWKIGFRPALPEMFVVIPDTIDIRYLNQTEITIGLIDKDTGEWTVPGTNPFIAGTDYEFKLDFPSDVPENAFTYNFVLPVINTGEPVVTKLTINPNIPLLEAYPGDILITLNATKHITYKNFFSRKETGIGLPYALFYDWAWELAGKRHLERAAKAEFVVKVERFHFAVIDPPESIEVASDDIISIPIEIRNYGSHIDTFNFRAYTDPDSGLIVSPPPAVTIKPREVVQTKFSVATPRNFQDPGTVHSIEIEAYSVYDTEATFKNTVTIVTRGVYVSEFAAIYFAFFVLLIVLGALFLFYQRKRILSRYCKKPKKPWNLSEEKKYLEKLKKKDKKEFNKVFKMMEEEYTSSLLWYKYYKKAITAKKISKIKIIYLVKKVLNNFVLLIKKFVSKFKLPKRKLIKKPAKKKLIFKEKKAEKVAKLKKEKPMTTHKKKNLKQLIKNFSNFFKLPGKKVKEVKEVEEVKPIEIKKIEKRETPVIDKAVELEKRRKEQLLVKIQREQEKQRRKIKKSIH